MSYYLTNLLSLVAIFTILGASFNLLMGYTGLFSIAHGAFFGVGAYTTGILMRDHGWSFVPAAMAAMVLAGVASALVGISARRVTDVYLVILTLAFQVGVVELFSNLDFTGGDGGLIGIPRADIFGYVLAGPSSVAVASAVTCGLVIGMMVLLVGSPFGRSLRAVREDEMAARSLGKATGRIKVKSFAVSSAMAGLAGALFAIQVRYVSPGEFGLDRSIEVLSLSIIGGVATWIGPLLGAAVVVLIPQALGYLDLPDALSGAINGLVFSALVILFLRFRPAGLMGGPWPTWGWSALGRRVAQRLSFGTMPQRGRGPVGSPSSRSFLRGLGEDDPREVTSEEGPILRCEGVSVDFGGLQAVDDVSFELRHGTITGLVGPNGAGKTTLFNVLSGVLTPDSGRVVIRNRDVTRRPLDYRARLGVVRSFQDVRLFQEMSAFENVMVGLTPGEDERLFSWLNRRGLSRAAERARSDDARSLLQLLGLERVAESAARDLSYAEQKLLMMGRLLATRADCYLLDEPMSGLDSSGRSRIIDLIKGVASEGSSVCLVEHSLEVIREVCSWVVFLGDGAVVAEGETDEITGNAALTASYFGR